MLEAVLDHGAQDERDALQARVLELEARFLALTDGLDVGVVIHGPETEILFVNPRAAELLGASIDQLRGKTSFDPRWRALRDDGHDFPAEERPTATAFRTRRAVRAVVVGIFRPETKDRVWLLVSAIPQLDEDGSILQVVATFADITAQKEAENRIRAQAAEIVALSVPFIRVAKGVGLMPIVGVLDEAKAHRLLEVALGGASTNGSSIVILDMTGVPSIAREAVPALARLVDTCRLVGAEVVMTGLSGEAAQILAREQVDFPGVKTFPRLQTAMSQALSTRR